MSNLAISSISPNALRQLGVEALTNALGPVGMASFIRQYDNGYGDYTKERHSNVGDMSVDEIYEEIVNNRK